MVQFGFSGEAGNIDVQINDSHKQHFSEGGASYSFVIEQQTRVKSKLVSIDRVYPNTSCINIEKLKYPKNFTITWRGKCISVTPT